MKLLTNDEILKILETTIRDLIPYVIVTADTEKGVGGAILTNKEIKDLYNEIRMNKCMNIENNLILEIVEFQGIENSQYWGIKEGK